MPTTIDNGELTDISAALFELPDGSKAPMVVPVDYLTGEPLDSSAPAPVMGSTAADAAIANPPLTVGGRAATTNPTAVSNGDVVNAMYDTQGRQVVTVGLLADQGSTGDVNYSDTASHTLIAAGATGIKRHISMLTIANENTTTGATVTLSDGTVNRRYRIGPNSTFGFSPVRLLKASSAATAWTIQSDAAVSLRYCAEYEERN